MVSQQNFGHKKKLGLYLGIKPYGGGMFQYAQSILEALSELSSFYDIAIAYDKRDENWRPILERFNLNGIVLCNARLGTVLIEAFTVLRLPVPISRYLGEKCNPLIKELLDLDCDLWIFPSQDSLTFQIPSEVIGTIHDLMHRYEPNFPEVGGFMRYRVREYRLKNIAKYSSRVLVDSNVGKTHVADSFAISKRFIYVLPYIAPSYLKDTFERPNFDSHYELPKKFVFYPAQFWAHKNHIRLLEAVDLVSKAEPDIHIVFSGGGKYGFKKIKEKINSLRLNNLVTVVGYIPETDMSGFYRRARALVMPTFFGPTNIPPLEAMLMGCPVLVSDIYGMREQCGDAAIYFDPKSVNGIADSISRIWNDDHLNRELIQKGMKKSLSNSQKCFNNAFKNIIFSCLKDR